MDLTSEALGARIRAARKARGHSQSDLAKLLNVSTRTVYAWEKGENGGAWDHLEGIERVIGTVTVEDVEPSLEALAQQLRIIAIAADTAREIVHALASE